MNKNYKRIKILMIKKELKNKDLALMAGCDPSYISHIIKGRKWKRKMARHIQRVIALQLDVPVESIFPNHRRAA